MKRLMIVVVTLVLATPALFAHGGNDHVRGVVTVISAQSIVVQTTPKVTKTLVLSDKTVYKMGGKTAHLADVKVGSRVVVDVPEGKLDALEVQIGAASTAKAAGR